MNDNYIIIADNRLWGLLKDRVNENIKDGYIPIGGICAYVEQGVIKYAQAMIKKEVLK